MEFKQAPTVCRLTSMATMYSATRPLMLPCIRIISTQSQHCEHDCIIGRTWKAQGVERHPACQVAVIIGRTMDVLAKPPVRFGPTTTRSLNGYCASWANEACQNKKTQHPSTGPGEIGETGLSVDARRPSPCEFRLRRGPAGPDVGFEIPVAPQTPGLYPGGRGFNSCCVPNLLFDSDPIADPWIASQSHRFFAGATDLTI